MNDDGEEQPRGSKRHRDESDKDATMTNATDSHQTAHATPPRPQPPPTLKLRNYRPKDKSIRYQTLPRPSYNKGHPNPPHTSYPTHPRIGAATWC